MAHHRPARGILRDKLRTWIEIDKSAVRHNERVFRSLLRPRTKLWSVVKSNAYGHGLSVFAKIADRAGVDGFCVDSFTEALRLRAEGIAKPVLVMGLTMPAHFREAAARNISITISTREALRDLSKLEYPPEFHLKVDTGMHRHGFYPEDLPWVIKFLKPKTSNLKPRLTGVFTHFASAKDMTHVAYTETQFKRFERAARLFERHGFAGLVRHCAATGGTLVSRRYHLDAVRVGIGLYGLYPSKELEVQLRRPMGVGTPTFDVAAGASRIPSVNLKPVLSWRTIVGEVKRLTKGDFVGYDLTERMHGTTTIAILPVGYWHGISRNLSSLGEVLVHGKRARIVGRVSMDITVVKVTGIPANVGDVVTIIGHDGKDELRAGNLALTAGTTHYEFVTRLNPLIERIVV